MEVRNLAEFVKSASFEHLSEAAVDQLKIRLLDSLGTAIGAVEGTTVRAIRNMLEDFGGTGMSTLIGTGRDGYLNMNKTIGGTIH